VPLDDKKDVPVPEGTVGGRVYCILVEAADLNPV
jgi:hypothetical protein